MAGAPRGTSAGSSVAPVSSGGSLSSFLTLRGSLGTAPLGKAWTPPHCQRRVSLRGLRAMQLEFGDAEDWVDQEPGRRP